MLEQFLKSILSYFNSIEPMNAYIQNIPQGVEYPCYLVNKVDINTQSINVVYFVNNVTPYIRIFGQNEVELKNKVFNLIQNVFNNHRKIPLLNLDGTPSGRYIRVEDIDSTEIIVDENEVYCIEINFNFDTTHRVSKQEFDLLKKVELTTVEIPLNL